MNKSAGIIAKISPKHKDINSVVMNIDEPMAHWGGLRENLEANQMALPRKVSNQNLFWRCHMYSWTISSFFWRCEEVFLNDSFKGIIWRCAGVFLEDFN